MILKALRDIEREAIIAALMLLDGNRYRTAKALGIALRTLTTKIRQYREEGFIVPEPTHDNFRGYPKIKNEQR